MPHSTNKDSEVVSTRVPAGTKEYYTRLFKSIVLQDGKDELFLFIKKHPRYTIDKVIAHFRGTRFINERSVMAMCDKTGLTLADYPLK